MHAAAGTGRRSLDAPQTSRPAAQLQALLARNHRQLSMDETCLCANHALFVAPAVRVAVGRTNVA
jgi:hypothetical protein